MAGKLVIKAGALLQKRAQGQPGEGPSFEQQFGILSNAQITDKYPALGSCKVAFQLQQKNDQNTFAVGAAVYNLGGKFIYIPSVFRQGKIWTGVIMFVPSMDRFLPISDAWLSYVKNSGLGQTGDIIPAEDSKGIATGPQTALAKDYTDPFVKTGAANKYFRETLVSPTSGYSEAVDVFDAALRLGKKASAALLDKLADVDYLNDALRFYSPEQLDSFAKKASEMFQDYAPTIITVMDKRASQLSEEDKQELYRDGFIIKMASEDKVDVSDKPTDIKSIRVKQPSSLFVTPKHNCKCSMLRADGELADNVQICVAGSLGGDLDQIHTITGDHVYLINGTQVSASTYLKHNNSGITLTAVTKDGWTAIPSTAVALASSIEEKPQPSFGENPRGKSQIPWQTMLVTPDGFAVIVHGYYKATQSPCIFVNEWQDYALLFADDDSLKKPIIGNRSAEFPKGTKMILKASNNQQPSSANDSKNAPFVTYPKLDRVLDKYISKRYNKIKLYSDGQEVQVSGQKLPDTGRTQAKQAALNLVTAYGVSQKDAKEMIKQTMSKAASMNQPYAEYFYITKKAGIAGQSGDWEEANIGMSMHEQTPPTVEQRNLNDYAGEDDPSIMEDISIAVDNGIKEVFDMQTLKLLVQSADPTDEIMNAIPDLMNCLDKLGRLIFLYHSHIEDMEKEYGAVKMNALSRSLQNTLKDLAQLTVFIKLRGINNDTGHNPDAGELQTGSLL